MNLTIKGPIRGGKNNMKVSRSGHHYPTQGWAQWRDQAVIQLLQQATLPLPCWNVPLKLLAIYYPPDKRRRDATALLDAIFHVFERARIIADDSNIKSISWVELSPNPKDPKILMDLSPIYEEKT